MFRHIHVMHPGVRTCQCSDRRTHVPTVPHRTVLMLMYCDAKLYQIEVSKNTASASIPRYARRLRDSCGATIVGRLCTMRPLHLLDTWAPEGLANSTLLTAQLVVTPHDMVTPCTATDHVSRAGTTHLHVRHQKPTYTASRLATHGTFLVPKYFNPAKWREIESILTILALAGPTPRPR